MNRRRLGSRIVALLCAYAFLLQAFLAAASLTAHAANVATGLVCNAQTGTTAPAAPAPTACELHCLVPGLGCDGPFPAVTVAARVVPNATVGLLPQPFAALSRAPQKTAQHPRAPPVA